MEGREKGKVVPFQPDAAFFFERGVRYLDRHDLSRALKSFERAVQCEPSNAVNHCNLAGVLSELGDFEQSNEVLRNVISDIAPDMAECHFYMANNYANLGEYELAEEHVVKYLEIDPTGEFAPDADEMLDVLIHEYGGGEILRESRRRQAQSERDGDSARSLLEEGKFHEASALLEKEIVRQPESAAARNNLALARYYLGQLDEAIALTRDVLNRDPNNVHALCNLAVFSRHNGQDRSEHRELLGLLRKLMPLQFDQGYKLATTLGILGEHRAAYRVFLQLVEFGDRHDPALYFALAAASANVNRLKTARQWLLEVEALDPDSGIADHFLREVDRSLCKGDRLCMSYTYQLPFHLRTGAPGPKQTQTFSRYGSWTRDPSVRSSLVFALFRGSRFTKREALQALAVIADSEVGHVLRDFVSDAAQPADIVWNALFVLQRMNVAGPIETTLGGRSTIVHLPTRDPRILCWDPLYAHIGEKVCALLREGDGPLADLAGEIWLRFVLSSYVEPPKIVKRAVWEAALEYVTRRSAGRTEPQAVVAKRYEVSVRALARAAHAITLTL